MKTLNAKTLVALASLVILAACGGGSSGGSTTSTTPTVFSVTCPDLTVKTSTVSLADAQAKCVVTPPVVRGTIVTSVPAATYAAGSEELAAFNLFNAERKNCGYGLVAQNDKLDVSSKGHSDYLLINGDGAIGHYQTVGNPGFTGVDPQAREAAAGYGNGSFKASEVTVKLGAATKVGQGVFMVRNLLNAPYHAVAMTRGYRDTGFSVRDSADVGIALNNRTAGNIDLGYKFADGMQKPAAGSLRTYPCEGSTGVNRFLAEETPSPVPTRNLAASPLGTSIAIAGDVGTTLALTSASMINVATNAVITMRVPVTSVNDPYGATYLLPNEGYVLADASLEPLTAYKVTINGTNNSASFSRTFTFTTGSGDQR